MTTEEFDLRFTKTVRQLSNPETYKKVCHEHHLGQPLPSPDKLNKTIALLREILFPGYFGNTSLRANTISHYMGVYIYELFDLLNGEILAGLCLENSNLSIPNLENCKIASREKALSFIEFLPEIRRQLVTDVEATYLNDPAAKNYGEVIFCYPAIRAITNYRVAHKLLQLNVQIKHRYILENANQKC